MWCWKFVNMLQMKKKFVKAWRRFLWRRPIYPTKNHHLDKKVRQREVRMGSFLPISKFASKKVENPCENQVCFKSCILPRDIGVCWHHHNLLQLPIFAFINSCVCLVQLGLLQGQWLKFKTRLLNNVFSTRV
jgi:hypothetical protein